MSRRITFVLGAGASLPFLSVGGKPLSTPMVAKELSTASRWGAAFNLFEAEKNKRANASSYRDRLDFCEVLDLCKAVSDALACNPRFSTPNFEYLVHLLDKAGFYLQGHDKTEIGQLDAILLGVEDTLRNRYTKSDPDGWRYLPWITRELILSIVDEAWRHLQDDTERFERVLALHKTFFDWVTAQYDHVSVYSLNYDPLMREALSPLRFRMGFLQSGMFSPNSLSFEPRLLAPLHGSVGFVPSSHGVRWENDYAQAQTARVREIVQNAHAGGIGMKGLHASTYMVTGLDKLDPFSSGAFSSYYQRFSADALAADMIVLVGIGFGDDHLNAFLTHLPLARPSQRLVVVDLKQPDEVRSFLNSPGEFDLLPRLASVSGDFFAVDPEASLEELERSIDAQGYGRFTKHIHLYARGTECFLKDRSAWPVLL